MTIPEFLAWQWSDCPPKHRHRVNLAIHIVAVPLFMLGCAVIAFGILWLAPVTLVSGLVAMLVSVVLQGVGHRFEPEQASPFDGVSNFLSRFFVEQWVTFPRFVFSGRFLQNLAGRSTS